jgi:transcription-repair coupling factor (superfamily II helicase)
VDLIRTLLEHPTVADVARAANAGERVHVRGSHGSSTSFLAAGLAKSSGKPVLLVVAHLDDADECVDELTSAGVDAVRFPALEVLPGETSVSLELFAERVGVVRRVMELGADANTIVVAPIQALMQPVPGASSLNALLTNIRTGQTLNPGALIKWLETAGYQRVDAIEETGDYASRGGIIDIFPPAPLSPSSEDRARSTTGLLGAAIPVRIDFFGDQVDRITEIDLDTMGSDCTIQSVELVCASLEKVFAGSASSGESGKASRKKPGKGRTENGAEIEAVETASIDATGGSNAQPFLEYMPKSALVMLHEPLEVVEQARGYFERLTDPRIYGPPAVLKQLQERFASFIEVAQFSGGKLGNESEIELPIEQLPEMGREAADAIKELGAMALGGSGESPLIVCVMCQNPGELSRFGELLDQHAPDAKSRIHAHLGYVHRGFIWRSDAPSDSPSSLRGSVASSLLLIPYHELLHRFETRRRAGSRGRAGAPGEAKLKAARAMDTFLDFAPGHYVVHRDHGIALFNGLITMQPRQVKRDGPVVLPSDKPKKKDRKPKGRVGDAGYSDEDPDEGLEEYLTLEFAGKSILYIPTSKIDQVQKYVGGFRGKPTLSALGGTRWKKQKEQVSESVKDLAGEMMRIRAARASMPGIRYPADTNWQKEFEAEFPYTETEDQLAALSEIKKDMTREQPMDRLLCGDVGYGKTEVAIRAAFKAVEFGKQVAVLVPTTVLAEQHERTFKSRFADYPFRVESISRFKTTKEINDVLAAVRKGQVDIIIGTHRLLSKDVKFSDLGLVVIDEEQRFGVEHKERLLSLRLTVDVLTLSATPIPRTLHLSMLGLRDISSLTTAPVDRRAVVTEVIPYNSRRIQQAIQRELARDGQIFFVHNRVHDILSVADNIQKLAPDAKIVVGHGQMADGELEEVMLTFMRRKADILVSTTIIESGIDIPTANTMFIDGADRFGLAELHQLRGRVGRYKHRAYCYMLLPEERTVTEKAVKRLKAIEEFSMLGAGFKIAMRDLEIRGAGNILGPEQSGHIAAVGYEMYCQLLDRAVKELKNEPTNVSSETSVEIGVSGMIPKRYIPSDMRRMEAYRRIAVAQTQEDLERIETELKQAYGQQLPLTTQRLLELASLRVALSHMQVRSAAIRGPDVIFRAKADDAARLASQLREGPRAQSTDAKVRPMPSVQPSVTLLPPPSGETLSEVYFRPPENYMDPTTLLRVLRARLVAPASSTPSLTPA